MAKYKLCLFYTKNLYEELIDNEYSTFEEIDNITKQYENEETFRNNDYIRCMINKIESSKRDSIEKLENERIKRGKVAIVRIEKEKVSFIRPLYKVNRRYESPKILIDSIIKRLKNANDIDLLCTFLDKYKTIFYTEFNLYRGIQEIVNSLYNSENKHPMGQIEEKNYNKILDIIKETLEFSLDNTYDKLSEDKTFLCRRISNYLDCHINKKTKVTDDKKILSKHEEEKASKQQEVSKYLVKKR